MSAFTVNWRIAMDVFHAGMLQQKCSEVDLSLKSAVITVFSPQGDGSTWIRKITDISQLLST